MNVRIHQNRSVTSCVVLFLNSVEFFTVCTKLAETAVLASTKGFNKNRKKLPPVGLAVMQEIIASLGVQCLTN